VTEATPPPRDSEYEPATFFRGIAGLTKLLERRWRSRSFYVGEWHFHPFASARPSPRDLAQMRAFAADPRYRCSRPILIVLGGDPESDWTMEVRVVGTAVIRLTESRSSDGIAIRQAKPLERTSP